jgi:DNA polymerase-1
MNAAVRPKYETITTMDRLEEWIKAAYAAGVLAFDTETDSLDVMSANLVGIALSTAPMNGCYIPLSHDDGEQLPLQDVLDALTPLLVDPFVTKVLQNAKFDLHIMHRYGVHIAPVEDTMLKSYAMYGGKHRHGMDELAVRYLNYQPISFKQVAGNGTFNQVPLAPATQYSAEDADITLRLAWLFHEQMGKDPDATRVYCGLDRPLIDVLAKMERRGVLVDRQTLSELTTAFRTEANRALDEAEQIAGPFNPASPQQVAKVLEKLGVRIDETTDSGQTATGASVLEDALAKDQGYLTPPARTLIKSILEFRKFNKLIGTYTEGLQRAINPTTGRVHPSFGMASTTTGRLACSEPNLQNIPIRTDEGKLIRSAFIPEEGNVLISADYSQIELRALAHATGDETLLWSFDKCLDIHQATAATVWRVPFEKVTKDQRRNAKTVNFGIIYGMSAWGLSRQLGISTDEADRMIDDYFRGFPGILAFMERAKDFARANGYVPTIYGRKVWVPDINSTNQGRRHYAERAAVNAPIQGTAADVIKAAMLSVDRALEESGLDAAMLLQVHDELVFEASEEHADAALVLIKKTMENAVDYLDVPLLVDAKVGRNWLEAH